MRTLSLTASFFFLLAFFPLTGEAYALIDFNSLSTESLPKAGESEIQVKQIKGAEDVQSDSDLESYIRMLLLEDKNIEAITADGSKVEIKYKQKGRLLALLPVTLAVSAAADPKGKLSFRYPWYSAITLDNEDEVRTNAKVAVDNALRAHSVGSVKGAGEPVNPKFTPAQSAIVLKELKGALSQAFGKKNTPE